MGCPGVPCRRSSWMCWRRWPRYPGSRPTGDRDHPGGRRVLAYRRTDAACAMVGRGLGSRVPGSADRRVDDRRRAAAAVVNPVADTVSALAALGATDRWVMTLAFVAVGLCDAVTGAVLRPAAPAGRLILIGGAVAGMLVAANPEHAGGSASHAVWASLGFVGLAAWPAAAWRRGPLAPWCLRRPVCFAAVALQLTLLAWFVSELVTGTGQAGLAERVVGVAQAIWPLVVVLSCRSARAGQPSQEIHVS